MFGSALDTAPPPTIPGVAIGPLIEEHEPVLLWVHSGEALVEVGGERLELQAGTAVWIPPGHEHRVCTASGSVLFPFFPGPAAARGPLARMLILEVPHEWESWLIHCWDDNSYTRDAMEAPAALLSFIVKNGSGGSRGATEGIAPPMPRSREALEVARRLLRHPASSARIDARARRESVSVRTLQRQFLSETGYTFSAWRTRARISIAARGLSEGRQVSRVAQEVGFATSSAFARSFRFITGSSPGDYARSQRAILGATDRSSEDRGAGDKSRRAGIPVAHPGIPARAFWGRINDHHELMWVYRGEAVLHMGSESWSLSQGHAIWVPAGLTHTIDLAAESLVLTVGVRYGRVRARAERPSPFVIPEAWEGFFLHTMIGEFSELRAEKYPSDMIGALFREQFVSARHDADRLSGLLGEISRVLRRDPSDSRSLADWARLFEVSPRALGQQFVSQTGETYPRWRARLRMDSARELLRFGVSPGQVGKRAGYASPAAFSRAFTTVYGISPREYCRREGKKFDVLPKSGAPSVRPSVDGESSD